MSERIKSSAVVIASPPERAAGATGYAAAGDLIRVAQGCYAIFWGLLMAVVVGTQLVIAPRFRSLGEALLGAGVLAVLAGAWRLHQARLPARAIWRGRTRWALAAAGLMAYFCVLFYFWLRLPTSRYLAANALAFVGATILFLFQFCRVIAAFGAALGERQLMAEARMYAAGSAVLLGAPFAGAVAVLLAATFTQHSHVVTGLLAWLGRANTAALLIFLLPFSLTLALAWAAKDVALRKLVAAGPTSTETESPQ
jgi:hypothetical protein